MGRSTEGLPGVMLAGMSTLFAVARIDCQFYSHFDKNQLGDQCGFFLILIVEEKLFLLSQLSLFL
uniref:Uncharacterized protein n=1 Tax=Caudovirales sp. ctCVG11 TaxID=2825759 RepID=A0A8S5UAQ0_9CAUD|nr:MAG TPA: hypothetical protein [Caudovirales sp. ctCVG11]